MLLAELLLLSEPLRQAILSRSDTTALEAQMRSVWPSIRKHIGLTHAVTSRQHRVQAEVNKMTEIATAMKSSYLLIQSAIQQNDASVSSASKRLAAELILQAGIFDRLDVIDEPIQFAMDHYELANTRITEHRASLGRRQ